MMANGHAVSVVSLWLSVMHNGCAAAVCLTSAAVGFRGTATNNKRAVVEAVYEVGLPTRMHLWAHHAGPFYQTELQHHRVATLD